MKRFLLASVLALAVSGTFAAPTVLNLSAIPPNPNAGKNSGGYPYNPVYETLGAGTYSVGEVGIAGGGLYDAYAVYPPTATNSAYTDSQWFVSLDDGVTTVAGRASIGRFDTAALALAAYSAQPLLEFTLTSTTRVAFYINDSAQPYFDDDAGGVSLAVSSVPEPTTVSLVAMAAVAVGVTRRRSRPAK